MKKKLKAKLGSDKKAVNSERRKRHPTNPSARKAVAQTPAPAPADHKPAPSYKVYFIAVDEIKVEGKRRQVNAEKVQDLKDSVAKLGLRTPLTIRKIMGGKTYLITGLHRLEAVKALGWKKVPCVYITGGRKVARLWEISENLDRSELTALEESELILEWFELTDPDEIVSAQNGQKPRAGRPKGGISEAARKLPGKGTESAKRHKLVRAVQIGRIDEDVKRQIVDAGFADSPSKLVAIAEEKGKEARLKKIQELKASRRKRSPKAPAKSVPNAKPPFEVMKREWPKAEKLMLAWNRATRADRLRFIREVLKFHLDDE